MADDLFSGKPEPGNYRFKVMNATPKTYQSGNEGIDLELSCAGPTGPFKVYSRLVKTDRAQWKTDQFLEAIGQRAGEFPRCDTIVGTEGSADCVMGDRGYLEVKRYCPPARGQGYPETPIARGVTQHSPF